MSQASPAPTYHVTKYIVGNRHLEQKNPLGWPALISMRLRQQTVIKRPRTNGLLLLKVS